MTHRCLLQIPVRDWLRRLGGAGRAPLNLHEVPEEELASIAASGFEWVYLLGIWQTGPRALEISQMMPALLTGYHQALSDFKPEDVSGSPFAVREYKVHQDFGGEEALRLLRSKMARHGLSVMLDFMPNHFSIDHRWTREAPDLLLQGSADDLRRDPNNYVEIASRIFAHGRDPYFPGWTDTLQIDYSNPDAVNAMRREMSDIARQCDGVRCDMAMLILPEIFQQTWSRRAQPFWEEAIADVKAENQAFVFCAEVYWSREWDLQQLGFDYTYDKTLYDRLMHRDACAVRSHLLADQSFQNKSVRFLENHDEPRVAAELPGPSGMAAAVVAYTIPGLRFFHDGQLTGARRKASVHLRRREIEPADPAIEDFYKTLLSVLKSGEAQGQWSQVPCEAAWQSNHSHESILAHWWVRDGVLRELIVVNYSDHQSQAYLRLPIEQVSGEGAVVFEDAMGQSVYKREREELGAKGLYVDLTPWQSHLFRVSG